jgi:drug/metabolite transporter (DMT)-like permease
MDRPNDLRRGAVFMLGSAAFFAGMSLAVKLAARQLGNAEVVFYRNAFGLLAVLPWALRLGWRGFATAHLREHLVRGLAGLAAMYCFFYAIAHMPLAEAVLLNYSLPLFMPIIENLWLGERAPRRIFWPIGLGFLGLLLILRPGVGLFNPVALLALLSALLAAVAQVGIRKLTESEPPDRIVLYFCAISTLVSGLPLAAGSTLPGLRLWPLLLAMGVLATLAQLCLTRAYQHAPASRVGPFIYASVVFAGLLDAWFWRHWPDAWFLAGATLVCLAGVLALRLRRG